MNKVSYAARITAIATSCHAPRCFGNWRRYAVRITEHVMPYAALVTGVVMPAEYPRGRNLWCMPYAVPLRCAMSCPTLLG